MREPLRRLRFEFLRMYGESCMTLAEEHEAICSAFEQGKTEWAVEIIRHHIDNQEINLYTGIKKQ